MDPKPPANTPALAPEDFYLEGPYIVFTAAYHRKRGYCCGSGCRHCPYRTASASESVAADSAAHSAPPPGDD